jgi:hypothetical protein
MVERIPGGITEDILEYQTCTLLSLLLDFYYSKNKTIVSTEIDQDSYEVGNEKPHYPHNSAIIRPQEGQEYYQGSYKKPDYTINILDEKNELKHVVFTEVKSLIKLNKTNDLKMLDINLIYDSISYAVQINGGNPVFVIAIKGPFIAFYHFDCNVDRLNALGIPNYKGFTPVNQMISREQYLNCPYYIHTHQFVESSYIYHNKYEQELFNMGVLYNKDITFPHIFNLMEPNHDDYVHFMFGVTYTRPGLI